MKQIKELTPDMEDKCPHCEKEFIPDIEAKTYGTNKWDGHSYKANCDCFDKNIRFSNG